MKRKEILKKKIKLSDEIKDLIKKRDTSEYNPKLNKTIEEKKKQFEFYDNLLKNM